MKEFFSHIRGAVVSTVVLAIVCCGLYPLVVFGISQALFRDKANGSLIVDPNGMVHGSTLLAQGFTAENIFIRALPLLGMVTMPQVPSGSNLGPTSQKLNDAIKDRVAAYRKENGLSETESVPADAVTASGSGLDPHISLRNAELQTPRVAKARGLSEEKVRELIQENTDGRDLGVLGEPGVNVLKLNLALDARSDAAMKPLFTISSAMNDSARIQSSQTGEPTKTYVFVFVPVYITRKTVASTRLSRRNLLLKLRRILLPARSTIALAILDLVRR